MVVAGVGVIGLGEIAKRHPQYRGPWRRVVVGGLLVPHDLIRADRITRAGMVRPLALASEVLPDCPPADHSTPKLKGPTVLRYWIALLKKIRRRYWYCGQLPGAPVAWKHWYRPGHKGWRIAP